MPHLEPAIESAIKWENPNVENGRKTFPIGPILWEKNTDGSMTAFALGSENNKPRRTPVLTVLEPVGSKAAETGAKIVNTPIAEEELRLTTVGTATQPVDPDPSEVDIEPPPSDSPRESDQDLPIRTGTSDTRYAQQHRTHAAGQLADGTPDAAVNDHGAGDKTVTMEPSTVGQAPKDVSIPQEEPPAPGYVEQAKQAATNVAQTVVGTAQQVVGMATGEPHQQDAKKEKVPEKTPEQKELEAKIDGKDAPVIEDFLRSKTSS